MASRKKVGRDATDEVTYPLGAVTRLTGLSEHVLRAWERRHQAVDPIRTEGGTRRYRESDIERLRLLGAAVDAGHPIGDIAGLSNAALRKRGQAVESSPGSPARSAILAAVTSLDVAEAERLIGLQLAALGPVGFARELALPLLHEIGDGWARKQLCIASEHMASSILRSLLGAALRATASSLRGPALVFAAPAGEQHDLGVLIAALTAQAAGAHAVFLAADLPADEMIRAAQMIPAAAVVVGIAVLPAKQALPQLRTLRKKLPASVELWVGGPGSASLELPANVQQVGDLDHLEQKVALLREKVRGAA